MTQIHATKQDAINAVLDQCNDAIDTGEWLALSFCVRDGKVCVARTQCNFKTNDLLIAAALASCNLLAEYERLQPPRDASPLPQVKLFEGKLAAAEAEMAEMAAVDTNGGRGMPPELANPIPPENYGARASNGLPLDGGD